MQTEVQTEGTDATKNEDTVTDVIINTGGVPEDKPKQKTRGSKAKPKVSKQPPKIIDEKARNKAHIEKWNQIVGAIESGDKIAINTPQGDIILCGLTPGKAWALDENGDSIVKGIKLHRSYLIPYINSARKV